MCREALCIAENVIHPRLPVVGVEAISRCIADSCSRTNADSADTELSIFGHQIARGHTDAELSRDNVPDKEIHHSTVTELCPVPTAPCAVPLSAMESSQSEEQTEVSGDDVICSPTEESMMEDVERAVTRNVDMQNGATSPACGQELEKLESVVATVSSCAVSPQLSTLSMIVRENGATDETAEEPMTLPDSAPTVTQCDGSGVVKERLPESCQSESEQSLRKRKYSTASSVNDGDDSGSEGGEIEV